MPKKNREVPYEFIINALGEAFRIEYGYDSDLVGSIEVTHVAKEVLTDEEYAKWSKFGTDAQTKALEAKVNKAIKAEFDRQAREQLTVVEYAIASKVWDFQKLNHDRFRIYGGIDEHRKPYARLVTEFIAFVDQEKVWEEIKGVAEATDATFNVLWTGRHIDSYGTKDVSSLTGRKLVNRGKPDKNGYIWSTGPDHNRKERQVEFAWDILNVPNRRALQSVIQKQAEATAAIWKKYGVGVI